MPNAFDGRRFIASIFLFVFLYFGFNAIMNEIRENGKKDQVIDQLIEDNTTKDKEKEVVIDIKDTEIDGIVDVLEDDKKKEKEKENNKREAKKKIDKVIEDTSLTEREKFDQVSEIQIDSLWDSYCSTSGSECVKG